MTPGSRSCATTASICERPTPGTRQGIGGAWCAAVSWATASNPPQPAASYRRSTAPGRVGPPIPASRSGGRKTQSPVELVRPRGGPLTIRRCPEGRTGTQVSAQDTRACPGVGSSDPWARGFRMPKSGAKPASGLAATPSWDPAGLRRQVLTPCRHQPYFAPSG